MVFFLFWCVGVSWALWNFFCGALVPNHFRRPCGFAAATHILCQKKTEEVLMSNPSRWVQLSRKASAKLSGGDHFFQETAVVRSVASETGVPTRSFMFMCAQFTFSSAIDRFEPATVAVDLQ